jgi:hypothetical protein
VASQVAARADLLGAFPEEKLRDLAAMRRVGEQFPLEGDAKGGAR